MPRLGRDRGEEIDQTAIGIAQQRRAIAPGHGGGCLFEGDVLRREADEIGIDVRRDEFDDHRRVGGGAGNIGAEQRQSAGAGNGQRAGRRGQLGEIGRGPGGGEAGDGLVEGSEGFGVFGDDAEGNEVHVTLQLWDGAEG